MGQGVEIHEMGAAALLRAMAGGELTSQQIVEALHRRADTVDASVGALVHQFREEALARAREADEARARGEGRGPLHGLPLTIKENIATRGTATTIGMRARKDAIADQDAVLVKVAREAGAIILGKTNVPQTLLSPMETTNALWGTTRNPFHLDHGPGGSSGGEGAALASGTSVAGIGTDIGGSIRNPSAFCGVAGLKPTANRWSNRGSHTVLAGQEAIRSQTGPMARTSEDLALLFRGIDPMRQSALDPQVPPLPAVDPAEVDLSSLRVGVYDDDGFFTPSAAVRRSVRMAADALERAGAQVVRYDPPASEEMLYLYFALMSADGTATVRERLEGEPIIDPLKTLFRLGQLPDTARRGVALGLRAMGERRLSGLLSHVGEKSVQRLWQLTDRRAALLYQEMHAWDQQALDAVVCPAQVTPACPHGASHDFTVSICYVARANLLNLPAGVVPVTRVRPDETERDKPRDRLDKRAAAIEAQGAGLPLGAQVIGRAWREEVVLRLMQAIERGVRTDADFPGTPVDPRASQLEGVEGGAGARG